MKLSELRQALQAADPAAVLASPRVLDRVIQQVCRLPNLLWNVPHRECYVVDRQVLFRHVEQDDLDLEPDQLLPATVILLARPSVEELNSLDRAAILSKYWRLLFHANMHLALETREAEGRLTAEDIRERIERIGRAEFEEIRAVLTQDRALMQGASERAAYVEFVAVYLELRYFAANLLPTYFPGIRDFKLIDHLLERDLDADVLFARTRLAGAPDPVLSPDTSSDEAHDYYWRLIRAAERAARSGNTVRAGILRTKAARVAPASLADSTRASAEAEIQRLTKRLQAALLLTDTEAAEWAKDLTPLLDKADQGSHPVEAVLLFDLQKVCLDHERNIYDLSLVEWALSAGKRPIKRPLPSQRLVRITSHLRNATQRLTMARLSDTDRQHLARLLQTALQQSEERLRARFRPVFTGALHDVGLQPTNAPERTAFHKLIEEMLDRISSQGFLTFSDLRDALSRNQLKLPDLTDPQDFVRGDLLLRLDRRLAALLDGVYRPSELYSRLLERLTALSFGTATGRLLTLFVLLPFGGAFLILQAGTYLLDLAYKLGLQREPPPELSGTTTYLTILLLGLFLMALIHVEPFRRRFVRTAVLLARGLHWSFIDLPRRLMRITWLGNLIESWPFQLFYGFLVKPLVVCVLVALFLPDAFLTGSGGFNWAGIASVFLAAMLLINSRFGRAGADALSQGAVKLYDMLRSGLIQGLFRFVLFVFKRVTDAVESVLFSVDEWLRFRTGDTWGSMIVRTSLGVLWFPVSYVVRFYVVVLVEPMINPIKLPISILAAKFVYPLLALLGWLDLADFSSPLVAPLAPYLTKPLAWLLVIGTFYLLPDAFAYLAWELKENWRLYRANRSPNLRPIPIGPHGETVHGLLRPGFHSGTIPKLYTRLRHAEREAIRTGSWRAARTCRHGLQEVERALRLFVERNLIALLRESASWKNERLSVGHVELTANRIALELVHAEFPERPVWLEFEERKGWLIAAFRERGWLDHIRPEQSRLLTAALTNLYRLAGVDLVREQVRAQLPADVGDFDVTARRLVLWADHRRDRLLFSYDLRDPQGPLKPRNRAGALVPDGPVLDPSQVLFSHVPLTWQQWVESWQKDSEGREHPSVFLRAATPDSALLAPSLGDGNGKPPSA
jgi:hypothetical protein